MSYILKTNLAAKGNYGSARAISKIKYIVWHYTANDGDTDEANAKFFKTSGRGASAHYFVDDDSVTRSVPDNYVAWSVGGTRYSNYRTTGGASLYKVCTNTNSINIELCDTVKNGKYDVSSKTLENAIALTKYLMNKYNVPISNVIRHFDVTGKSCPAYYVNNTVWNSVKAKIANSTAGVAVQSSSYSYNGVDYSSVFSPTYYANKYTDLKAAFGTSTSNLFNHFINNGMKERRQAIDTFNVDVYRSNYADLRSAFGDDYPAYYRHYCTNGKSENRKAI